MMASPILIGKKAKKTETKITPKTVRTGCRNRSEMAHNPTATKEQPTTIVTGL